MMQMLGRGGLPILTDEIRAADADNPRGYYEWEAAKKLKVDSSWVPSARGKVIKVISQLLYDLPITEQYRVVFMQRELDEVLASQEKMLERRGNPIAPRARMRDAFSLHLERLYQWLATQPQLATLMVSYNAMMASPESEAERIAEFLNANVNPQGMLEAIDPELYRNRN